MFIQMIGYKMLYKNIIYNLIGIAFWSKWNSETATDELDEIEATYIDENNRIAHIKDKYLEFQFFSK
jgi:hypothetical protein